MWLLDEELRIEVESLPFMTSLELFLHALGEEKGLLSFLVDSSMSLRDFLDVSP